MSPDKKVTFYDIASAPPLRTFAANPWKTRFALNYKNVPYRTQWTDMPDIRSVREKLGVPANRTLPDGTPYHTLPVIHDTSTNELLGESFEIALYLDTAYPSDHARLFRDGTIGLTAAFNAHVDSIFTGFVNLCTEMPFDPRIMDAVLAMFASRLGGVDVTGNGTKTAEELMAGFEAALGELAKAYRHTGGTTDHFWRKGGTGEAQAQKGPEGRGAGDVGPWLDGDVPAYADFIVGAWLKMFEATMKGEEWAKVRSWQGGLWGRVVDALGEWTEIK